MSAGRLLAAASMNDRKCPAKNSKATRPHALAGRFGLRIMGAHFLPGPECSEMNAAQANNMAVVALIGAVLVLFVLLIMVAIFASSLGPWMRGFFSGVPVSIIQILGMRLRGVPPRLIVDALVTLVHRGHPYDRTLSRHAESLYLAQRGLIQSPEHLADLVEKRLKADGPA